MEGFLVLLGVSLALYLVLAPGVALLASRRLNRRLGELQGKLDGLERRLASGPASPTPSTEAVPAPADDTPPQQPVRPQAEAAELPATADVAAAAPEAGRRTPAAPPPRGLEERFAARWMIWLGALAVALSVVFLFRHAIEQGWLTPMARVLLGLVLGGALLAGGEWSGRHPPAALGRALNPDYVPPALTASGIFAIFVSLYAAHALYGLLTPGTAFVALGLVAYAALGLALRQGWFVALIGLAAGYLTPGLIDAPEAQALPVFLYLFLLGAGCLGLMIWRKWWWFALLTLLGAFAWPASWLLGPWSLADQGVLGAYGLGLALLFAVLSTGLPLRHTETPFTAWLSAMLADTSGLGFTLSGVLLLWLAGLSHFNAGAFAFLGLYAAAAIVLALWRPALESLTVAAAAIALAAFLLWPLPPDVTLPDGKEALSALPGFGPVDMPPEFRLFARALVAFAALFGLGGFVGLGRGRTTAVWAGLSAVPPVLLFAIGYWRIGGFEVSVNWAFVAAGLALLQFLAAVRAARMTDPSRRDPTLAFYAAGVTAALALAFTCLLREAWLSVALALEILALGWIWQRLRVRALRALAAVLVAVVLVRLVANPELLNYQGRVLGLFGWVVYGYGIPAAAIFAAARFFAGDDRDMLVPLSEIAAAGLAFLMVALQLKLWTSGALYTPRLTLLDQAVQSAWWITSAGVLLRRTVAERRAWAAPAGLAVLAAAALLVVLGPLLQNNPAFSDTPSGRLPLINLLALAYLLPAVQFWAIGTLRGFVLPDAARQALRGGAGLLVFAYVTLETRRSFWGSEMRLTPEQMPSDGEIYAYSAVWIVFALALLALGILRGSQALRYASLAVLIATVAKVFLYDMSDLTGLFRVASFLGLGLTLIGIGRVYQRYVFRPAPREPDPAA